MLARILCFLLFIGLALSSPTPQLAKRYAYAEWTAGQYFDIKAAGPPFAGLDDGIGFYFQTDGNFVVYKGAPVASDALWNSMTAHYNCQNDNCQLNFQNDGNFVIYVNGGAVWNTGTGGGTGKKLEFRNTQPYITIYGSSDNVIWSTPAATKEGGGGGGGGGSDPCSEVPCVVVPDPPNPE